MDLALTVLVNLPDDEIVRRLDRTWSVIGPNMTGAPGRSRHEVDQALVERGSLLCAHDYHYGAGSYRLLRAERQAHERWGWKL